MAQQIKDLLWKCEDCEHPSSGPQHTYEGRQTDTIPTVEDPPKAMAVPPEGSGRMWTAA